jgi:hypothetical protein
MFTLDSSKPIIRRVATSLKLGVLLALLGLIVVATERPILLTPAGAVTVASDASYVAGQARPRTPASNTQARTAASSADSDFTYFPSQFASAAAVLTEIEPRALPGSRGVSPSPGAA